jgi:hypothetical protein
MSDIKIASVKLGPKSQNETQQPTTVSSILVGFCMNKAYLGTPSWKIYTEAPFRPLYSSHSQHQLFARVNC